MTDADADAKGSSTAVWTSVSALGRGRRGQQFIVSAKGSYGAGKSYNWDDVVAVCTKLQK